MCISKETIILHNHISTNIYQYEIPQSTNLPFQITVITNKNTQFHGLGLFIMLFFFFKKKLALVLYQVFNNTRKYMCSSFCGDINLLTSQMSYVLMIFYSNMNGMFLNKHALLLCFPCKRLKAHFME